MSEYQLQRGDRLLFYTDGVIEEHVAGQEPFGEEQLIRCVDRMMGEASGVRAEVRWLSQRLVEERGGITSDDATLFLVEWRGGVADHLALLQ